MSATIESLELADEHIQHAVRCLVDAALSAPDWADVIKNIATRVKREANEIYALRGALTPSLSALLEESLGASAGEPTA